jgi:Family of unknown function (DUF6152)
LKNKIVLLLAIVFCIPIFLGPVSAHHGTSVFDMDTLTTVKGTVTKFEFMNPHALIYVDVEGKKGDVEHWIAEESSNNHLSRSGWDKNTLKVGDQITIVGHRARNGARVLELQCAECSVTDPQGKVWPYQ